MHIQGILNKKLVLPIALAIGAIGSIYLPTLISLHNKWVAWDEFYAHGYLSLLLIFFVLWENRWRLSATLTGANPLWLIPIVGASFVWLMAAVAQVMVVQQILLPVILSCTLAALFGSRFLWVSAPILVIFYTIIPFWEVLTPVLQGVTVWINSLLIASTNITALIDGNYIIMPSGVIEIASGCSGLGYFLVSISLAAIGCNLELYSLRNRIILMLAAVFLALITNWVRVFLLILIGYFTDMQHSLMTDHVMFGWYIYIGVVVILVVLIQVLKKREVLEQGSIAHFAVPNTDAEFALGEQSFSIRYILLLVAAVSLGPAIFVVSKQLGEKYVGFESIGTSHWSLSPIRSGQWLPKFVGSDWQYHRNLERKGKIVSVHGVVYARQSQGKELIGAYNSLVDGDIWHTNGAKEQVQPDSDGVLYQIQVSSGSNKRVVWYWYQVGGVTALTDIGVKLQQVGVFFYEGRSDAAFVALSTACNRTCDEAVETLGEVYPELSHAMNETIESGFINNK